MSRIELERAFGDFVVAARRAELSARDRDELLWFVEKEARLIREPLHNDEDAWADLGGIRRAAR